VEFLGGRTVIHAGDDLPVSALTNHAYRQALSFWKSTGDDGNTEPFRSANYSLKRFAWAADGVRSFDAGDEIPPVEQAFSVLERVAVDDTQWRIVYDIADRRIHFRTLSHPQVRHLDLASFDFSCSTPVKVLDMLDDLSGEVAGKFSDYTYEANHRLMRSSFRQTPFLKDVPDESLAGNARYPEQAVCTSDRGSR
jgi:choloylglycine hydrolase